MFKAKYSSSLYALALAGGIVGGALTLLNINETKDPLRKAKESDDTQLMPDTAESPIEIINSPVSYVVDYESDVDDDHPSVDVSRNYDSNQLTTPVVKPTRLLKSIDIESNHVHYTPSDDNGMEFPTEKKCRRIIEEYFQAPFPKYKGFCINPLTDAPLELDGYNDKLKIAFEYQGDQHYNPNHDFWRCKPDPQRAFAEQRFRDRVKVVTCKRRGIRLIVIPPTVKKKKLGGPEKVLNDYLTKVFPMRR